MVKLQPVEQREELGSSLSKSGPSRKATQMTASWACPFSEHHLLLLPYILSLLAQCGPEMVGRGGRGTEVGDT